MGAVKNETIPAKRAPIAKAYPKKPARAEDLLERIEAVHTDKVIAACCDVVAPNVDVWDSGLTREERVAHLLSEIGRLEKARLDGRAAVNRLFILGIIY